MDTKLVKKDNIIRQCGEADFKKVFSLFAEAFRFNPRLQERDYCDWQFKNTPFSDQEGYSLLVSSHGDRFTGCLGYLPIQFRFAEEIRTGCISFAWHSLGKDGVGIKLLSELMGRYDNIFFFDYSPVSEAIFKMFRMPMCSLSRWVGVLNQGRVNALFHVKGQSRISDSHSRLNSITQKGDVHACKRFGDGEEFFFDQWPSIKSYIRRTGKYLNWRYVDIPRHDYQIIRDDKGHFAVYRIEQIKNHADNVIRILEWNFYGKSAQYALALIIEQGHKHNAILIDFISSAIKIGEHLQSLGFFQAENLEEGIPFLFRPICQMRDILVAIDLPPHRVERDFNFNEWYITKGDSDMDRIKL